MDPPENLSLVDMAAYVSGWPTLTAKVNPEFKAYLIQALHQEAFTTSTAEYIRVILANHLSEVLGIPAAQILRGQPTVQHNMGRRFRRIK
jgi:hypothetical protein